MKRLYRVMQFICTHPLSKRRKLSAIFRFCRWQLATRISQLELVVPFVNDTKLIAKKGITCVASTYYVGLVEYHEMVFAMHYLRPEDLFIDVGANVGVYTVLVAGAVGASCVSIEPIPETFDRLLDNVNLNRLNDRVQLINAGLGEKTGKLPFTFDRGTTNHVVVESENVEKTTEVEIATLDHLTRESLPEMVKIDVEGFESQVIAGGRELFGNPRGPNVVLMELRGHGSRYGFNEESVHRDMLNCGYQPYVYDPRKRELHPWRQKADNVLGDMLYIRDVEKAKQRVKQASTFHVARTATV